MFKWVINDVIWFYFVKSYGLIVFFYGSGWFFLYILVNGLWFIIIDNDNEMEIIDFVMVFLDYLFEFIIFEVCNMVGIEVVYELRNKVVYIMVFFVLVVFLGFIFIYVGSIFCLFEENVDL